MFAKWVTWVAVVTLAGAGLFTFQLVGDRTDPSEPTDAMRQRDLLVSRLKVGDMRLQRGDLPGALEAHRECLAIAERGAAQDPANATWQRDLAIIHFRLSFGLKEAGDLEQARTHAATSVTIYERLAETNSQWRDERAAMQGYLDGLARVKD